MLGDLIVTIGCPGAGKSTWADKNLGSKTLRLERDRFREAIWGSRRAYHESDNYNKSRIITNSMKAAMSATPSSMDVAVTDTGLFYRSVAPFIERRNEYSNLYLIIFDVNLNTLKDRNTSRHPEHRISEDVLETCYNTFVSKEAWWRDLEFAKNIRMIQ